jgi:hypothetical protein
MGEQPVELWPQLVERVPEAVHTEPSLVAPRRDSPLEAALKRSLLEVVDPALFPLEPAVLARLLQAAVEVIVDPMSLLEFLVEASPAWQLPVLE